MFLLLFMTRYTFCIHLLYTKWFFKQLLKNLVYFYREGKKTYLVPTSFGVWMCFVEGVKIY